VTLNELVERVRNDNPAVMAKLDDRAAMRVVRAAFAAVAADVDSTADGVCRIAGLGAFRVRDVAPRPDGKGGGRLVTFKPASAKAAAR